MIEESKQDNAKENDAVASPPEPVVLRNYTTELTQSGYAILYNNKPLTRNGIVHSLNDLDAANTKYIKTIAILLDTVRDCCDPEMMLELEDRLEEI